MLKVDSINYTRLAQAQAFYAGRGYLNVEIPWLVTPTAVRATLPIPGIVIESIRGALMNAGEQGFIQKMFDGEITPGLYQTTTPCFIDTPAGTEHSEQVSLICYQPDNPPAAFEQMVRDAMDCFFVVSDVDAFDARQTDEGVDIAFNGTVIATFGMRQMGEQKWVYGVGLNEPSFTLAVHSAYHVHSDAPAASNEQEQASVLEPPNVVQMPSKLCANNLDAVIEEDRNSMSIDVDNGHHL